MCYNYGEKVGMLMKKHNKRAMKRFFIGSLVLIALLVVSFFTLFQDWLRIASNKQELARLEAYYNELLDEEESLNSEVTKLHDEDYVARYAREKYMYSLPGEIIIKIPDNKEE